MEFSTNSWCWRKKLIVSRSSNLPGNKNEYLCIFKVDFSNIFNDFLTHRCHLVSVWYFALCWRLVSSQSRFWSVSSQSGKYRYACVCAHRSASRRSSRHSRCNRCTPVSEGHRSPSHTGSCPSRRTHLSSNQRAEGGVMSHHVS